MDGNDYEKSSDLDAEADAYDDNDDADDDDDGDDGW